MGYFCECLEWNEAITWFHFFSNRGTVFYVNVFYICECNNISAIMSESTLFLTARYKGRDKTNPVFIIPHGSFFFASLAIPALLHL